MLVRLVATTSTSSTRQAASGGVAARLWRRPALTRRVGAASASGSGDQQTARWRTGGEIAGDREAKKGREKRQKRGRRRGCCFKLQAWEQVEVKVLKRREDVSFHLMLQEIDWNVLWQQQSPMDMSNSFNTIQTIELGNIDFVKFCFFTSS